MNTVVFYILDFDLGRTSSIFGAKLISEGKRPKALFTQFTRINLPFLTDISILFFFTSKCQSEMSSCVHSPYIASYIIDKRSCFSCIQLYISLNLK